MVVLAVVAELFWAAGFFERYRDLTCPEAWSAWVHGFAVVLFARGMLGFLPVGPVEQRLAASAPFAVLALLVPVFGMAIAIEIPVLLRLRRQPPPRDPVALVLTEIPVIPESQPGERVPQSSLTGAEMAELLAGCRDRDRRLSAILATLRLDARHAVALLRLGLKDPVDDIRLLAYSLLNRREVALYRRVEQGNIRIAETSGASHFDCRNHLAAYLDLVDLGLAEGAAARVLMESARTVGDLAIGRFPGSAGLQFQQARILLLLDQNREAIKALSKAGSLGISETVLRPHLDQMAVRNPVTEQGVLR